MKLAYHVKIQNALPLYVINTKVKWKVIPLKLTFSFNYQ